MAEEVKRMPLITITEGIAFFLSGVYLIGTSPTIKSDDLLLQRLVYVAQYTGYVLSIFGIVYVLSLIPKLSLIRDKLNAWTVYAYPIVFGITSAQVLGLVLDQKQSHLIRWSSGIFIIVIMAIVIFRSSDKKVEKIKLYSNLVFTYIVMAIIFIALRAPNWWALVQSPILEPLFFLIVCLVCMVLLYRNMKKEGNE